MIVEEVEPPVLAKIRSSPHEQRDHYKGKGHCGSGSSQVVLQRNGQIVALPEAVGVGRSNCQGSWHSDQEH